jgi:hypothetical protein
MFRYDKFLIKNVINFGLNKNVPLCQFVALEQSRIVSAVTLTVFGFTLWLVSNVLVLVAATATTFHQSLHHLGALFLRVTVFHEEDKDGFFSVAPIARRIVGNHLVEGEFLRFLTRMELGLNRFTLVQRDSRTPSLAKVRRKLKEDRHLFHWISFLNRISILMKKRGFPQGLAPTAPEGPDRLPGSSAQSMYSQRRREHRRLDWLPRPRLRSRNRAKLG